MKKNYIKSLGIAGLVALSAVCPLGMGTVNVFADEAEASDYVMEETFDEETFDEEAFDEEVFDEEVFGEEVFAEETIDENTGSAAEVYEQKSGYTVGRIEFYDGYSVTINGKIVAIMDETTLSGGEMRVGDMARVDWVEDCYGVPVATELHTFGDPMEGVYIAPDGRVIYTDEYDGGDMGDPAEENPEEKTMWLIACPKNVELRADASENAEILAEIPRHAQVTYLGEASNGFALVNYEGVCGYVLKDYLGEFESQSEFEQFITPDPGTEHATEMLRNVTVQNADGVANIRHEPSLNGIIAAQVPNGTKLIMLDDYTVPVYADGYAWYPVMLEKGSDVAWIAGYLIGY